MPFYVLNLTIRRVFLCLCEKSYSILTTVLQKMFLTFEVADDNSVGPKSTQLKIQKKEFITNTVLEKIG
jgi:hypothetical protein